MSKITLFFCEVEGSDETITQALRAISEQLSSRLALPSLPAGNGSTALTAGSQLTTGNSPNEASTPVPAASADRTITGTRPPETLQSERNGETESEPEETLAEPATPSKPPAKSPPAPALPARERVLKVAPKSFPPSVDDMREAIHSARKRKTSIEKKPTPLYEFRDNPGKFFDVDTMLLRIPGATKQRIWSSVSAGKKEGRTWVKSGGVEFRRVSATDNQPQATVSTSSPQATSPAPRAKTDFEARPRHSGDILPINGTRHQASEPPPVGPPTWHRKETDTVDADPVTA